MTDYKFTELIDTEQLQQLMDSLSRATGFPSGVIDTEANIVVASGWQKVCTDFHRVNPCTASRCRETEKSLIESLCPGQFTTRRCQNGLYDFAAPIHIGGKVVGTFLLGQLFIEEDKPDMDFFHRQAEEFGFDSESYLRAVGEVPVFSRAKVQQMMDYSAGFVNLLSELGHANRKMGYDLRHRRTAKEQLRASEEKFRQLFDNANELIFVAQDLRIKFCNAKTLACTGYTEEELLKKPFIELVYEEDRQLVTENHTRRLRGEPAPEVYSFRAIAKGNEVRWLEINVVTITWESRPATLILGSDITERKLAEQAIVESEEKFRHLAEQSPNMIFINKGGRIVYVNEQCCSVMKYNREDFYDPGFTFVTLIAEECRNSVRAKYAQQLESRDVAPYETKLLTREGKQLAAIINSRLIQYEGAQAILGVVTDISQQKLTEERNNAILQTSMDGFWVTDAEGNVKDVNQAYCHMVGYERSEMLQMNVLDMERNETPESVACHVADLRRLGYMRFEATHHRKDGTPVHFEVSANYLESNGGEVFAFFRDMSERKMAETALRESEEKYRMLVENQTDLVVKFDPEGRFLFVSPSYCRLFGKTEAQLLGQPFMPLVHEDDRELTGESMEDLFRPPYRCYHEQRAKTVGGWRWLAWADAAVLDDDNQVMAVVGVGRDITARKEAEDSLVRHRAAMEAAADGMAVLDSEGRYTYLNRAHAQLYGYDSPEELIGESWEVLYDEKELERFEQQIMPSFTGHGAWSGQAVGTRRDGTQFDQEVTLTAIDGGGLICVVRDITERKALEREILKVEKLESVGVLAGGIAHDFNNSLAAILGNISLARMDIQGDDEVRNLLGDAERAALQAQELTRQLLTFAKGGAPVRETTSIRAIIRETAGFTLRGSNVKCTFDLPDDLWPVEVDRGQISQVIHNLTINADHAMPEGGTIETLATNIEISARDALPLAPGRYVKISVTDHGIGIREDHLARVFDPYFTTKQKGSGLGLASAYSIMKKHDGFIDLHSTPGQGATFDLYLPATDGTVLSEEQVASRTVKGCGSVLVMDDEEFIVNMLDKMLTRLGYEPTGVADGRDAVALYQEHLEQGRPFDVVIMDLTIPGGMGGKDAVAEVLRIDPEARVIVSSGYSNDPIMADYRDYGFAGYIAKPYRAADLNSVLASVLSSDVAPPCESLIGGSR